jgi:hypothetical protein
MKSGENYLDLIETHKQDKKINLFEKSYSYDQTGLNRYI